MKYGNANQTRKLTPYMVQQIRDEHLKWTFLREYGNKHYSAAGIAARLGVHVRTIEKVLNHETWNVGEVE